MTPPPRRSGRRRLLSVVGTRPNFMKVAPVVREIGRRDGFDQRLVHTGQHYDDAMSRIFLEELGLPEPDSDLGVGSGSHSKQLARVVERLEPVLDDYRPDLVIVAGDVNSTLAAALAATHSGVPIAHIEAGLRSFDRTMPEEINRVLTDTLSALLFIHSPEARTNLMNEGCDERRIHDVGNTMIDTLIAMLPRIRDVDAPRALDLTEGGYLVVTLHRPALVDGPLLPVVVERLAEISHEIPVVFPAHPRTRNAIEALGMTPQAARLRIVEPLGYLAFLGLVAGAAAVLTDSGGVQEETTYLGIPCFTMRENTERPITINLGTNRLLGLRPDRIAELPRLIAESVTEKRTVPTLWDGRAAERIVDVFEAAVSPR